MKNFFYFVAVVLIAGVVVVVAPITEGKASLGSVAATPTPPTYHVLVLGDSYSAGNGAGSYSPPTSCYRSSKNYAGQFATALMAKGQPVSVVNAACSGATSSNITTTAQYSNVPKQIDSVNDTYDTIFLTIGGNDINFAGIVQNCLVQASRQGDKCDALLTNAETLLRNGTMQSRITNVLSAIHGKDQGAKVVLLGYPYLEGRGSYTMPKHDGSLVYVGSRLEDIQTEADTIGSQAAAAVNKATFGSPCVFVSVHSLFGLPDHTPFHGLYAASLNPDRWLVAPATDTVIVPTFYHPNPTGWYEDSLQLLGSSAVPRTAKAVITTTALPQATLSKFYDTQLTTADHRVGTWTVISGHLPAGLTLSGDTIRGTPTATGASSFGLLFIDATGRTSTATISIGVSTAECATQAAMQMKFCYAFDGTAVSTAVWDVNANSGKVVESGGYVHLASSGPTFPYLRVNADIFPTTGSFRLTIGVKYESVGDYGDGVVASEGVVPNGTPEGATVAARAGRVWQDSSGLIADGECSLPPLAASDLGSHKFQFDYMNGSVQISVDGTSRGSCSVSEPPTSLWIGNPVIPASCACQWTSLAVAYVRIDVPTP